MDDERYYLAALYMANGVGKIQMSKILNKYGSAKSAWENGSVRAADGISAAAASSVENLYSEEPELPERIYESCRVENIRLITQDESVYPDILRNISDAPDLIYVRGNIPDDCICIAMVGSRKATPYGKSVAEELSSELSANGITVVSGAAYGIDTASHRGALKYGKTIAVLGCGVDVAYPRQNKRMLDEIASNGAVISEYAPGVQPKPAFFPRRNRIISGLSRGTVVVEAAERSGSLITAEMALSEGRDVFAVPGSVFSPMSKGCHRLIQQGAKLVTRAEDILSEYDFCQKATTSSGNVAVLDKDEQAVYDILSWDVPVTMDEIIIRLHGNVSNVSFLLVRMQIEGLIKEDSTHGFLRASTEGVL